MRLPSVPTLPMVEHLNTSYFHRVWNAPADHGRANFPLTKAAKTLQTGAISVNSSVVGLPTTDKVYAVYRAEVYTFGRFVTFPSNTWINDADLVDLYAVSMSAFSPIGRMIPTGQMWFNYDPLRSRVYVAIDRTHTSGCIGESYPSLYMSVYMDTSRKSPIVSSTYVISKATSGQLSVPGVTASINTAATKYKNQTIIYVNGWMYDPNYVPRLNAGDIVNIVSDPDIVGFCDLTVDDNLTGYYSDLFKEYREILHIPKSLNPNNYIITHDTLSIGIFDVQSNRGVAGHRVDINSVESITHNDFSMSRSVLQAFQDGLFSQGIKVRVYVRYATSPHRLESDVNHLNDLYTLSDSEIKQQLSNTSGQQIPEWSAPHLEKSAYIRLLYQFTSFTYNDILQSYSEAAGYFDVAAKLSQAVRYYTYKGGQVEVYKPIRLYGHKCRVIAYVDGRKIPDSSLTISDYSTESFLLSFKSSIYIATGSRISIYITEDGLRTPILYNPTEQNPSIVVPDDDHQLIRIVEYGSPKPVWKDSVVLGYQAIPFSPGDYVITARNSGGYSYKVNPRHYGEKFYLVPRDGLDTISIDLDEYLERKDPLIIPLFTTDSTGKKTPLIGYTTMEVYTNGYRLTEGTDYTCNPVTGTDGDVLQTLLQISSVDYLTVDGTGNRLEIVLHGDTVASSDKGYVISDLMHRKTPPMIWSRSCGRAFVDGRLVEDVYEEGNTLVSITPVAEGVPYYLEWSLPYGVEKLMASLSDNSDINLRTRVEAVLGRTPPEYPDTVVLTHLHALYSPFLAQIVSDVASEILTIVDEPKDDQFLKQFSAYSLLYVRDPVIDAVNPLIDRRFVTVAAHYANFGVANPQQMVLIQRLIALVLTPSTLSLKEVLS